MNTKIVALVPMRHRSVRVPEKNYRPLAGKPLYQHILDTLLSCPEISQVVVDTDSPVLMEGIAAGYPRVRLLPRPDHLTADTVPMNEILMYDTSQVQADLYLQTHSTNRCCARRPSRALSRHCWRISPPMIHSFRSHDCKPACGMGWPPVEPQSGYLAAYSGFTAHF